MKVTGMNEYIERETAIETIMSEPTDAHYPSWYADNIKAIPAADVAPVRHGRFKISSDYGLSECSSCGWNIEEYVVDYDYCPHCGAKMDLEEG